MSEGTEPVTLVEASDTVGVQTLEAFADAPAYNRWILDRFRDRKDGSIGRRILEVGAGIGNITELLLARDETECVVASDLCADSLAMLHRRLGSDARLETAVWDANDPLPEALVERFDAIVSSNVLEHIRDDAAALDAMHRALVPGGRLCLLVPAGPKIFSGLDEELDHFRRYRRAPLARLVRDHGFQIERIFTHNAVGTLGWIWEGKVLRRRHLDPANVKRFDRLVPFLRPIDPLLTCIVPGVSLIVQARKRP